jgi:hypothetical protein
VELFELSLDVTTVLPVDLSGGLKQHVAALVLVPPDIGVQANPPPVVA